MRGYNSREEWKKYKKSIKSISTKEQKKEEYQKIGILLFFCTYESSYKINKHSYDC